MSKVSTIFEKITGAAAVVIGIGMFVFGWWVLIWGPIWLAGLFWVLTPFGPFMVPGAWLVCWMKESGCALAQWTTIWAAIFYLGLPLAYFLATRALRVFEK